MSCPFNSKDVDKVSKNVNLPQTQDNHKFSYCKFSITILFILKWNIFCETLHYILIDILNKYSSLHVFNKIFEKMFDGDVITVLVIKRE